MPPLVFERARSRLETAYQEVFGAGSAPPASWLKKLGEELAAGAGLVDELDAAAIRGGLEMAKDNRRPFGLGWVILFVQKRQLERRDAQERAEKNPKPETRNSKLENEDLALRMREFFERLPEDRRREYEAAALAQKFVRPGTALHRAMAAQMAWGERPEIPVAREGE